MSIQSKVMGYIRIVSIGLGTVFFVAASLSCFGMITISTFPSIYWVLVLIMGAFSVLASSQYRTTTVVTSIIISLLGFYFTMRLPNAKPFVVTVFVASSLSLLLYHGNFIFVSIVSVSSAMLCLLFRPNFNLFIQMVALAGGVGLGSFCVYYICDAGIRILSPSFSGLKLGRAGCFLGFYLFIALIFAVLYHVAYINIPNSFRISPEIVETSLDLIYFIYWSFGVFVTFGPSEVMPSITLTRVLVVFQCVLNISWLVIFFSSFSGSLNKRQGKNYETIVHKE